VTARLFDCAVPLERERGLAAAEVALGEGGLVVLPTDTVYGLAANAFDRDAVAGLMVARGANAVPPVLVGAPEGMAGLAVDVTEAALALAGAFWPGGLTLVCRAQPSLGWGPEAGTVALRMPLHPVALELLARTGPLAVTAANVAGAPPPASAEAARDGLEDAVAVYLDGGACLDLPASTIVDTTGELLTVVREGAVPLPDLVEVVGPEAWDSTVTPAAQAPG
jgi:tRNA threonylcarbamoyl adenosine modification protein (Sua5/YciO/YrdC/YwlC family)